MNKGIIWGVVAVIVIAGLIIGLSNKKKDSQTTSSTTEQTPSSSNTESDSANKETTTSSTQTVTYADTGFSPSTLTIKKGDIVNFVNNSSGSLWPASNNHPTHLIYPEFDSKKGVAKGENFSFTFEKVGTWGFHNHLSSGKTGTITVTE